MPIISSLILTNTNPVVTYTASVVTNGTVLADGLGNQLTSLQLTASFANTASYSTTSSVSVISQFDISSSYASASATASFLTPGNNYTIHDLTASGTIIFPDPINGDVIMFNEDSALIVSSSGGSVGMGNGVCFADLSFQTPGLSTQGFFDNSQTPGRVTVWNPAFPALSSSVTTITEVETLNGVSSSVKLQTQIDGKQASLLTASVSPSTPGSPTGWVNIIVQGVLYWIPIYK